MENHLKERLTGAAILVALIVLLVPEMFHGRRGDVTASSGGTAEGPPVRSYTIDLSNSSARTAPLQSTPAMAAVAPVSDGGAASSANGTAGAGVSPSASGPSVAGGASSANGNSSAGSSNAGSPSSALTHANSGPAVILATGKPAGSGAPRGGGPASTGTSKTGAARAARAASGSWSVQLGLFASHENAERLLHTAQGKGFPAVLSERDLKGLYHVQMAGLADRAAAQALQQRLRDQGFAAAVLPPPNGSKAQQ